MYAFKGLSSRFAPIGVHVSLMLIMFSRTLGNVFTWSHVVLVSISYFHRFVYEHTVRHGEYQKSFVATVWHSTNRKESETGRQRKVTQFRYVHVSIKIMSASIDVTFETSCFFYLLAPRCRRCYYKVVCTTVAYGNNTSTSFRFARSLARKRIGHQKYECVIWSTHSCILPKECRVEGYYVQLNVRRIRSVLLHKYHSIVFIPFRKHTIRALMVACMAIVP